MIFAMAPRVWRGRVRPSAEVASSAVAAIVVALTVVHLPVVLAGAAAVSALVIGLLQPVAGFALVVASASAMLFVPHPALAVVLALLVFSLLVLAPRLHGTRSELRTPRAVAALVAYLGGSWLLSTIASGASFEVEQLLALGGLQLAPLLLGHALTRSVAQLVVLQWVVAGVACAVALLQLLTPIPTSLAGEPTGIGAALAASRNSLGIVYLLGLAVIVPRLRLPPRAVDVLLFVAGALLVTATAGSLSRSSYVAAAALVLAFLLLRGWRFGAVLVVTGLVLVPFALGGEVSSFSQALSRFTGTLSEGGLDASSGARLDLWQAALRAASEQPIFGLGYLRFAESLPELWEGSVSGLAIVSGSSEYIYAHNLYLTILSQAGVVGVVLLAVVVGSCVRDALTARGAARDTALLALVVVGAASLFGEPILVAAVSVPFLVINGIARMSTRADDGRD